MTTPPSDSLFHQPDLQAMRDAVAKLIEGSPDTSALLRADGKIALLKGRANYLCVYRLKRQVAQGSLDGVAKRDAMLARIEDWSRTTKSGDLAEVADLSDAHPVWPQVTSTRDNCLGQRCSDFGDCHVVAARRRAQEADLVVVNHHLLLADLALKEDGFGDLLGSADAVILDDIGYVQQSREEMEVLFTLLAERYERGSVMITSNLPFDEWTETFGSERLTGALLDRLTHHVNILEMNADSYRLGQSKARQEKA